MSKLPIAKINRQHFIEWLYQDRDEYVDLAKQIVSALSNKGHLLDLDLTADNLFDGVGYINLSMIENLKEIESELENLDGFLSGEVESPSLYMKVKWT
jgi:hypothetical protein